MTPLCALSHVPCHDSVRAAYKKPAAISKMAGIMENSGLEDRSTPVISSLAIRYFSLSLSPVNFDETFQPLSLSPLLGDSFGGGEYLVKKKERKKREEKGNIWTALKRREGWRKMLRGGGGEIANLESGKWFEVTFRFDESNFVRSMKL